VRVGPAHVLMARDQRETLRAFLGHPSEQRSDRLTEKRRGTRPMHIGLRECGSGFRSRYSPPAVAVAQFARGCGCSFSYHNSRRKAAGFWPRMRQAPIIPRPTVKRRPPPAAANADGQSKTKSENMIRVTTR